MARSRTVEKKKLRMVLVFSTGVPVHYGPVTYDYDDRMLEATPAPSSSSGDAEYWKMEYPGQLQGRNDRFLLNPYVSKYMFVGNNKHRTLLGKVLSVELARAATETNPAVYIVRGKKIHGTRSNPEGIRQCMEDFERDPGRFHCLAPHKKCVAMQYLGIPYRPRVSFNQGIVPLYDAFFGEV